MGLRAYGQQRLAAPLSLLRTASAVASLTVVVVIASGVVISFLDRETFPSVWRGLWWAAQTVTTVGYGDVIPQAPAARAVAVVVMVAGIGFLTIFTASIASIFVAKLPGDFRREEEQVASALEEILARLGRLEVESRRRPGASPPSSPPPSRAP